MQGAREERMMRVPFWAVMIALVLLNSTTAYLLV